MERQPVAIKIFYLCRFMDSFSLIIDSPSESVWSGFHTRGQLSSSSRIPSSSSSSSQALPAWEYYSKGVSTTCKINNSHWHQPFPKQVNASLVTRLSWTGLVYLLNTWKKTLDRKTHKNCSLGQKLLPLLWRPYQDLTCVMKALTNCTFALKALPSFNLCYEGLTKLYLWY